MPGPVLVVLVALATLGATALSACDTEDAPGPGPTSSAGVPSSAAPEVASDAVLAGIAALYAGDDATGEQVTEADCFADALLGQLDLDELRAAGIVQADGTVAPVLPVLDVTTAQRWVVAESRCADFVTVSTRAVVVQSKGKVDPEEFRACLLGRISPESIAAARVDTLSGSFDSTGVQALSDAQADCSRSAQPVD